MYKEPYNLSSGYVFIGVGNESGIVFNGLPNWEAKWDENIEHVKNAKVGIVFAEYGLAESGGVVLFSGADKGRSPNKCYSPLADCYQPRSPIMVIDGNKNLLKYDLLSSEEQEPQ